MLDITAEEPHSPDAALLIAALSAELDARYHDGGGGKFRPEDCLLPRSVFIVGREGGRPVACGALRSLDAETAEVKRMFVHPDARRRGLARLILADLERRAREFGYTRVRLETGIYQTEAIALYHRCGYTRIAPFGEWAGNPLSVCFEKILS